MMIGWGHKTPTRKTKSRRFCNKNVGEVTYIVECLEGILISGLERHNVVPHSLAGVINALIEDANYILLQINHCSVRICYGCVANYTLTMRISSNISLHAVSVDKRHGQQLLQQRCLSRNWDESISRLKLSPTLLFLGNLWNELE